MLEMDKHARRPTNLPLGPTVDGLDENEAQTIVFPVPDHAVISRACQSRVIHRNHLDL